MKRTNPDASGNDGRSLFGRMFGGKRSRDTSGDAVPDDSEGAAPLVALEVLFGTQTGNAGNLAQDVADAASAKRFAPTVQALDDVSMESLAQMDRAIFVVSTFGDGEMPDNAQLFWEDLTAESAPRLEKLTYGVLALGDTDHDEFCNAGRLLDERLEELGARRLVARVDCDVDYDKPAAAWIAATLPLMATVGENASDAPGGGE
ncbi:MAG: flavodoxin domain-containing protein [Pseudomonadota bacterium]